MSETKRYRSTLTRSRAATGVLALCLISPLIHGQSSGGGFLVEIALDNKITIQANDASLKEVLMDIESKTGIPVNFVADTSERVSIDIADQPLEDAIRKLSPNHMVIRGTKDGKAIISEFVIIADDPDSSGSTDGDLFLPTGDPAPDLSGEQTPPPTPDNSRPPGAQQSGPDQQSPEPPPAPGN